MSKVCPFVAKLFSLLLDPNNLELISWDSINGGFIIHNIARFEAHLMRQHFKNTSMSSFFRQLNLYGFKRTSDGRKFRGRGADTWCRFYHPCFNPGQYADLASIKRVKNEPKKVTKSQPTSSISSPAPALPTSYQSSNLGWETTFSPQLTWPASFRGGEDGLQQLFTNFYDPSIQPWIPGFQSLNFGYLTPYPPTLPYLMTDNLLGI
ncbi:hypothetical protein L0F63_002724 [Massospora cicadina]|nr:hypothetical protein L0F63_002724 [Massospora cicadina]